MPAMDIVQWLHEKAAWFEQDDGRVAQIVHTIADELADLLAPKDEAVPSDPSP